MDKYEGMDESTLKEMLDQATSYEERSELRRALRKIKSGGDNKKKVGSSNYRRAGYQAHITMAIPNSVTGNVLPNKVSTSNLTKVEVPQTKATISYLKSSSKQPAKKKSSESSAGRSPRGSVSSATSDAEINGRQNSEDLDAEGGSQSGLVTERQIPSPLRAKEVITPDSQPATSSPTPPPPKEPTPPPPKEPTPPPPKEPTPEPSPSPPREPTPPPKEPTPEPTPPPSPPREPTPPPKEPTPEPSPEPEEEEVEEEVEEVEEEVEEEEEVDLEVEEDEEEEEEEEESPGEGVRVNYDSDDEEERGGRVYSPSSAPQRQSNQPKSGASKTIVPLDVLTKKEEGVEDGDFRRRLQKASNTKIDTKSAFPQAKPKGEQVDFRNVLKKDVAKKVNTAAAFPQARQKGEQVDFRNVLRKVDSKEPPPPAAKKPSQRRQVSDEAPSPRQERSPTPEPAEDAAQVDEEQEDLSESLGSGAAAQEGEEEEPTDEQSTETGAEPPQEEAVDGTSSPAQQDETPAETPAAELEEDSYEARQAERKKKREQRRKEMAALMGETKPSTSPTPPTSEAPQTNGASELDSYEARREARRKAREERLKAASAKVGEERKMTYKEKKMLESRKNAAESRKQWENREEDTGAKNGASKQSFKKNTATQQLLAWCQHKTKFYENVEIKDFRSSWSDGLAFCAIMHSFLPDKIPYDELTAEDKRRNFTLAFQVAKDEGIPEMLDVDDMLAIKIPDAKSIMTFLVTIYQHFNS